jgi:23S rRNA pseudouridine2605 synthase
MTEDRKNPPAGRPRAAADRPSRAGERIARRLARAGIASRRDAEAMIAAGRITVNGKVLATPAFNVTDRDVILVDGAPIPGRERTRLFLFHKPAGTMTTNRDPEGRKTIFDGLPEGLPRLMTVGRLDYSTEGLLLMTNDGGLARVLELPSTGWLRRYRVRVHGVVDPQALEGLKQGIAVDGVFYGAIDAVLDRKQGSNAWLTVALKEGKNREVKKVLGALGLEVTRLIRVSFGPFQLGELKEGAIVELKGRMLRDQLGPRLIAASGADFDSEIRKPFSNKPVEPARKAPAPVAGPQDRKPAGRRKTPVGREEALDRLQTRRDRPAGAETRAGGKDRAAKGKGGGDGPRRDEPPRSRAANVWHAPGSRPLGPKGLEKSKSRPDGPGRDGKGAGARRPRGRNADRRR